MPRRSARSTWQRAAIVRESSSPRRTRAVANVRRLSQPRKSATMVRVGNTTGDAPPIGPGVRRVAIRRAVASEHALRTDTARRPATKRTKARPPASSSAAGRCASNFSGPAIVGRATSKSPTKPQPDCKAGAIQEWSITDLNSSTDESYGALRSARRRSHRRTHTFNSESVLLSHDPNVLNWSRHRTRFRPLRNGDAAPGNRSA
jgi:hypothetical protein